MQGPIPPIPTAPFCSPLHHGDWGRDLGRTGGPTWVWGEPVVVEAVRARLPVGLRGQGPESVDPQGWQAGERTGAAGLGTGCWWWRVRDVRCRCTGQLRGGGGGAQHPPALLALPAWGNSGAATKLKAATCCICAATAATGPSPGPCAAASKAAWCCRILRQGRRVGGCTGPTPGPPSARHLPPWCRPRTPRVAAAQGGRHPAVRPSAASSAVRVRGQCRPA